MAIGITQKANPKTVLAYSSISQMGVIAAVLGMGLAAGDKSVALDAAFYAATHVLAKGASVPGRRRSRRDLRAPPAANADPWRRCWRSVSADCA